MKIMIVKELTFIGNPIAKGRPKMTTWGGFARAYTPKRTVDAEKSVRRQAEEQWGGLSPLSGPLRVHVEFFMPRPKSMPKKIPWEYHVKKPDIDNLIKLWDALNGLCWVDDSQICRLSATKRYGPEPKTVIVISEICQ